MKIHSCLFKQIAQGKKKRQNRSNDLFVDCYLLSEFLWWYFQNLINFNSWFWRKTFVIDKISVNTFDDMNVIFAYGRKNDKEEKPLPNSYNTGYQLYWIRLQTLCGHRESFLMSEIEVILSEELGGRFNWQTVCIG